MSESGAPLLVVAIALLAVLVGRLFIGALGGRLYRRFDPAGAAAALALGAAVLTLLSVALSGLGFPTRELPPLIAALQLVPAALCARRSRLDVLLPRGRASEWTLFVAPLALTTMLSLLSVTRAGGFQLGGDTYTYCAFSEWLQAHGFSEPARAEVQSPVTAIPALWQSQGYDLGIAHWLALVQAVVRPASSLLVYPSTSAFGLVLLTAMVWLAAVQVLRVGRRGAAAIALACAAVPHALYWGHHNGFLQQGYALPLLTFGIVLVARIAPRRRHRVTDAALLAVPLAFLFSVYLPVLPLLGVAIVVGLASAARRTPRLVVLGELARFGGVVALFVLVFAGRDVLGALSPLHGFATHVAGGHVPFSTKDFFQFALGTRVLAPGWVNVTLDPWSFLNRALTPLYGLLVLAGMVVAARRPRTRPLAVTAGLVALGALYFALAVKDPWSGERGHTWNLFKLSQWSWPFVLLLAAQGVRRLAPARPPWRPAVLSLAFALPVSQVCVHWPWSDRYADAMRDVLPGLRFTGIGTLKSRVQELRSGTLLVVGRPVNAHRWLATTVSLMAYPRAVVGDWTDSGTLDSSPAGEALYQGLLRRWNTPHVVPLLAGFVGFQASGIDDLGGGFARLPADGRAIVVHVVNPAGLARDPVSGLPTFSVGKGRTKIVVFAPEAGPREIALSLRPYPGRPGTWLRVYQTADDYSHRSVRLASEGEPAASLALGGETSLRVELGLPAGLSTIVLVLDEGRGTLDAREPVTVVGFALGP